MLISFGDKSLDIRVRSERIDFNNMPRCHSHTEYELYCLTEGERYLFVGNRFYHVMAGDMFLISPEVEHRTLDVKAGGYSRIVVNIPPVHIPEGARPTSDIILVRPSGEDAERMKKEIEALTSRQKRETGGLGAYAAVVKLLELAMSLEGIAEGATVASPTLDRVADILKFIDENYTEDISLRALSDRFYLSEFYLCRLFKEYTGRTVLEYLTSLRVRRAKKLLLTTDLSVERVARSSGFGSVSAFCTSFRRTVGLSPRAFRKEKQSVGMH